MLYNVVDKKKTNEKKETLTILGNLKGDIALFECVIVKIKFRIKKGRELERYFLRRQ